MANPNPFIPAISTQDLEAALRSMSAHAIPNMAALLEQAINGNPDAREDAIIAIKNGHSEHADTQLIPRAVIVVEGGVVTGTYEDAGVEIFVYDFDNEETGGSALPLLPEWEVLANRAGVPCEKFVESEPEYDGVPRVLVTVSGGVADFHTRHLSDVNVLLIDIDDLNAGGKPDDITGFEDLLEHAVSPEVRALLGLPGASDTDASPGR